jgi:hypothetical protein
VKILRLARAVNLQREFFQCGEHAVGTARLSSPVGKTTPFSDVTEL